MSMLTVASFTDAWIETLIPSPSSYLKSVASFTDAWIETSPQAFTSVGIESHLLQMRGLKPENERKRNFAQLSHLLQMRGLKHPKRPKRLQAGKVASFTDAWIETTCESPFRTASKSHLLQMRGLKHA